MKPSFRRIAVVAAVLTMTHFTATSSFAAPQNPASQPTRAEVAAPTVVSTRSTLSAEEMAKYREKTAQSRQTANHKAAGASGNKTVWVVVGVAAVVGAVALASSGGGGGGY